MSLTRIVYVNKQVSLQAATAHAAEGSELKQKLERAEEELGRVKKQLEDSQDSQGTFRKEMNSPTGLKCHKLY